MNRLLYHFPLGEGSSQQNKKSLLRPSSVAVEKIKPKKINAEAIADQQPIQRALIKGMIVRWAIILM